MWTWIWWRHGAGDFISCNFIICVSLETLSFTVFYYRNVMMFKPFRLLYDWIWFYLNVSAINANWKYYEETGRMILFNTLTKFKNSRAAAIQKVVILIWIINSTTDPNQTQLFECESTASNKKTTTHHVIEGAPTVHNAKHASDISWATAPHTHIPINCVPFTKTILWQKQSSQTGYGIFSFVIFFSSKLKWTTSARFHPYIFFWKPRIGIDTCSVSCSRPLHI